MLYNNLNLRGVDMNILVLLNEEIKNKNWTLEEKARYLYLRSCQLFSYDPRYEFCDEKTKEQIRNQTIDLENLETNWVVCTSHGREVISEIMIELLNLETSLEGNNHLWVKLKATDHREIKLDSTAQLDLARVKMKLSTKGYISITKDYTFYEKLEKIDRKICYIEDDYEEKHIKRQKENLLEDFYSQKYSENSITNSLVYRLFRLKMMLKDYGNSLENDDFTIFQWKTIQKLWSQYQSIQEFTDAEFCISYLEDKLISATTGWKSNVVSLYQIESDQHWNFVNLYPVQLKKDTIYFMLKQEQDGSYFTEIPESDALHYTEMMDGNNKHLIYR